MRSSRTIQHHTPRASTAITAVALLLLLTAACAPPAEEPHVADPAVETVADTGISVERGSYLVDSIGCDDCHTPWVMGPEGPAPDMTRRLSGHPADLQLGPPPQLGGGWGLVGSDTNTAWYSALGIAYAKNLTPDEATGIGIWTDEIFINTIRSGRHWGVARPIMPPMPWHNYRHLTDEDLSSILAFLKTVPAIQNQVPEPVLPATSTPTLGS